MKKYKFFLQGSKTIIVEAENQEDARQKACLDHGNQTVKVTYVDDGVEIIEKK